MPILTVAGALIAMSGFALFMVLLFSSGGLAKSEQFRVLGELAAGRHGAPKRLLLFFAVPTVLLGMCTSFAGVAAQDAQVRRQCVARCEKEGFPSGRIGPSSARDEKRPERAAFVACHCEAPGRPALELRAASLGP
ncbi:MAG: hypothetical protein SFW67_19850 [Myxococcaceae bacterium]|nr:hypothetical protein [Myxococcaceae bacterium]